MDDKKHREAEEQYGMVRSYQHEIGWPNSKTTGCQICSTGRGMRLPGERHQTPAVFKCMKCGINVCGVGCWKLLHGYYEVGQEQEEVPQKFKGTSATSKAKA